MQVSESVKVAENESKKADGRTKDSGKKAQAVRPVKKVWGDVRKYFERLNLEFYSILAVVTWKDSHKTCHSTLKYAHKPNVSPGACHKPAMDLVKP